MLSYPTETSGTVHRISQSKDGGEKMKQTAVDNTKSLTELFEAQTKLNTSSHEHKELTDIS